MDRKVRGLTHRGKDNGFALMQICLDGNPTKSSVPLDLFFNSRPYFQNPNVRIHKYIYYERAHHFLMKISP